MNLPSEDAIRPQYQPIDRETFELAMRQDASVWNSDAYLQQRSVTSLRHLCLRRISLAIFDRWSVPTGDLQRVRKNLKLYVLDLGAPPSERAVIVEYCTQLLSEATKWASTHGDLFVEQRHHRRLFHPSEHMRMFFVCIVWYPNSLAIDYNKTAQRMLHQATDWPGMRFKLACAYAMPDLMHDAVYDNARLKVYERQYQNHQLYKFWLAYLRLGENCAQIFETSHESQMPRQCVSLAFQWAIEHGFVQLASFFLEHLSIEQFEYLGLLSWHKISFKCRHVHMFEWLCRRMCIVNLYAMARATWNSFFTALGDTLSERVRQSPTSQYKWSQHVKRLSFLLEHCCERLRWALFRAQHHRALHSILMYRDRAIFHAFMEHLNVTQLHKVRKFYETLQSENRVDARDMAPFMWMLNEAIANAESQERTQHNQ